MAVKFVNISKEEFLREKLIFKYMPLEYALDTLTNSHLWFANPVEWNDPFEKRFITLPYSDGKYFAWKDRVFCSCFTERATCEAHWNVYAKNDIGIEMTFNRKKLLEALNKLPYKVYIGRVEYKKTSEIEKPISEIDVIPRIEPSLRKELCKARLLLLKRIAFEYESEVRIIIVKPKKTKGKGILVKLLNVPNTIFGITIDPKVGKLTYEMLRNKFLKLLLRKTNRKYVQQSNLTKMSVTIIQK